MNNGLAWVPVLLLALQVPASVSLGFSNPHSLNSAAGSTAAGTMQAATQALSGNSPVQGKTPVGSLPHQARNGYQFASPEATTNFYVGAYANVDSDPSGFPNSGVEGAIQVVSQQVSGCLSYWVDDDSAANVWGQVGYYICNGSNPVAFYQVWNLSSSTVLSTGLSNVTLGYHSFSMYSVAASAGGDTWAFALDGKVFGNYDMGSNVSSSTYGVSADAEEGYVSSAYQPAKQVGISAVYTYASGDWSAVQSAIEPWACGATQMSCWGIEGNAQNSSVPAGGYITGGSSLPVGLGSRLWFDEDASNVMPETANASSSNSSSLVSGPLKTEGTNSRLSEPDPSPSFIGSVLVFMVPMLASLSIASGRRKGRQSRAASS